MPADQVNFTAIAAELSSRLNGVSSSGIPTARFEPALDEVREHLPTLVSGDFPLALTHSDLTELNILVDGDSGSITGVIDWTDAAVQPFGLTLYALEKFISSMGPHGWVYFDNAGALRDEFRRAFAENAGVSTLQMESIRIARMAGYFLRYEHPTRVNTRELWVFRTWAVNRDVDISRQFFRTATVDKLLWRRGTCLEGGGYGSIFFSGFYLNTNNLLIHY